VTPDAILAAMAQVPFPKAEEPRFTTPAKTNLRRIGQFSLTDPILLHRIFSTEAKLVLGFSINYPKLDPSLIALTKLAGLDKARVVAAQKELEDNGIVQYDRPEHFYDRRNSDDPRFDRSTTLARTGRTSHFGGSSTLVDRTLKPGASVGAVGSPSPSKQPVAPRIRRVKRLADVRIQQSVRWRGGGDEPAAALPQAFRLRRYLSGHDAEARCKNWKKWPCSCDDDARE
jgi:hypothetical protein